MAYTTYFLRFADQEEADIKLEEAGYKQEQIIEDEIVTYYTVTDQTGDIDIIGDIYNKDAVIEVNEDGFPEVVTPATKVEGYHVNIILQNDLPEVLQEFAVIPRNPYRVFA